MLKIYLKNFFSGLLDIIIFISIIYFVNKLLSGNQIVDIGNITTKIKDKKLLNFVDSLIFVIYLGLIPYLLNYKTIAESLLNIEPRIEIKEIEKKIEMTKKIKILGNKLNLKIEKFVYIWVFRFINFVKDIFGINLISGFFKIIKRKFTKKENNDKRK